MVPPRTIFSLSILFSLSTLSLAASMATYNVENYGAKSGGQSDSTKAFLDAWAAACASATPSMVYAPGGVFLLARKTIFLGQNCKSKITLKIDGTLVAPSDYNVLGHKGNWIAFVDANHVTISGGVLNGRGDGLWKCKKSGNQCPVGATTLAFYHSSNIVINNLKSVNSQLFHVIVDNCQNANLQGLTISNPDNSPNTDGIHIDSSSIVNILSSHIGTGDDCISIGPGTTSVWIENVFCGPGHGISIGSLGKQSVEPGVRNVTVKSATFQGTQNGVRIKTWARPSNGFVKDVLFHNVTMINAGNPIIIDEFYCPDHKDCPSQGSGINVNGVTYQQIHGTSSSKVAISIACSKARPCSGIALHDINLTYGYNHQPAQASCSNATGTSVGVVQPKGCF